MPRCLRGESLLFLLLLLLFYYHFIIFFINLITIIIISFIIISVIFLLLLLCSSSSWIKQSKWFLHQVQQLFIQLRPKENSPFDSSPKLFFLLSFKENQNASLYYKSYSMVCPVSFLLLYCNRFVIEILCIASDFSRWASNPQFFRTSGSIGTGSLPNAFRCGVSLTEDNSTHLHSSHLLV